MRPGKTLLTGISLSMLMLAGCSTHTMSLKYQPTVEVHKTGTPGRLALGEVIDKRDTQANWLGSVRHDSGYTLSRVYTDISTAAAVAGVLEGALASRGLLGDQRSAPYTIDVIVADFASTQSRYKKTHAAITVRLSERQSGQLVFQRSYRTNYETGHGNTGQVGAGSGRVRQSCPEREH